MHSLYRALVIYSPHAGRSQQLSEALAVLQQAGIQVVNVVPIADLDAFPSQDVRWREQNIHLVIAAGGDGLIGGVLPYVVKSRLPLGILPLGTSNNTARALRIPLDIRRAVDVITQGQARDIDVGITHPGRQAPSRAEQEGAPGNRGAISEQPFFFAHALMVGLHVQFARIATDVATRKHYGPLTYAFATFEVLQNPAAFEAELRFEGLIAPHRQPWLPGHRQRRAAQAEEYLPLHCRAFEVAVVNAPLFGGERQFTIPGAELEDGLLDIVVIEEREFGLLKTGLARFFEREFGLLGTRLTELFGRRGKPPQFKPSPPVSHPAGLTGIPGIHHLQARGVTITTDMGPQEVTLDGELRLETPLSVHAAPGRLRVLAPNHFERIRKGNGASEVKDIITAIHDKALTGAERENSAF